MKLFKHGQLLATVGALDLEEKGVNLAAYLQRHFCGDWGELVAEDKRENEFSLKNGLRLLSAYKTDQGEIWIITEADRRSTTVLLPSEY